MRITWNLRMLCAQKGVWTAAELGRRLQSELGLRLSATTLTGLLRGEPKSLSLNLLLVLCATLKCTPNDLLVVDLNPSRRTTKALAESIMAVNQLKQPKRLPTTRRRRPPAPPPTRI